MKILSVYDSFFMYCIRLWHNLFLQKNIRMKVMIVNGSPRKGNTWRALSLIAHSLNSSYEVSSFNLYDYFISGCRNCDACHKKGGYCTQKDDSNKLLQFLVDSDIVVLGTPVYYWGISAQMKLFIDKFYAVNSLLSESPKRMLVVACGANSLDDIQYELIGKQFNSIAKYLNWNFTKYIPVSAYNPDDIERQDGLMQQIKNIGLSL